MVIAMTLILISGIKTTFRWQNTFWIIATIGTFVAFVAFLVGNTADFTANFNQLNADFGGGTRPTSSPRRNGGPHPRCRQPGRDRCPPCSRSWSS